MQLFYNFTDNRAEKLLTACFSWQKIIVKFKLWIKIKNKLTAYYYNYLEGTVNTLV